MEDYVNNKQKVPFNYLILATARISNIVTMNVVTRKAVMFRSLLGENVLEFTVLIVNCVKQLQSNYLILKVIELTKDQCWINMFVAKLQVYNFNIY